MRLQFSWRTLERERTRRPIQKLRPDSEVSRGVGAAHPYMESEGSMRSATGDAELVRPQVHSVSKQMRSSVAATFSAEATAHEGRDVVGKDRLRILSKTLRIGSNRSKRVRPGGVERLTVVAARHR